jgi:hypothetical protein
LQRLNQLARTILAFLRSLPENTVLIFDNPSFVGMDKLPKKPTLLFVSSQFAATIKSTPEQIEKIFILEDDQNKVDEQRRFPTGERLIYQLAYEMERCYKREANECKEFGHSWISQRKQKEADRIHSEMRKIHERVFLCNMTAENSIYITKTTLVWLTPKSQDVGEVKKMKELFSEVVSSFHVFDNELDCRVYLLENEFDGFMFLIIDTDYEDSIVVHLRELLNVKVVYRYGQSLLQNEKIIDNYDDLCFEVAYDLIGHYNKLGTICSAKQDAKIARDIFMKALKICNIFAEL